MILHSREVSFLPGSASVSSYVGFELIILEGTKVVGVFGRTSVVVWSGTSGSPCGLPLFCDD